MMLMVQPSGDSTKPLAHVWIKLGTLLCRLSAHTIHDIFYHFGGSRCRREMHRNWYIFDDVFITSGWVAATLAAVASTAHGVLEMWNGNPFLMCLSVVWIDYGNWKVVKNQLTKHGLVNKKWYTFGCCCWSTVVFQRVFFIWTNIIGMSVWYYFGITCWIHISLQNVCSTGVTSVSIIRLAYAHLYAISRDAIVHGIVFAGAKSSRQK